MSGRFLAAVLITVLSLFAAPGCAPTTPAEVVSMQNPPGEQAFSAPETTDEEEEPAEFIVIDVDEDPELKVARYLEEAERWIQMHNYAEAEKAAHRAAAVSPHNANAPVVTIRVRNLQQNAREEEAILKEADAYYAAQQYSAAAGLYSAYRQMHPEHAALVRDRLVTCSYHLGLLAHKRNDCALAQDYFRQSLYLDPNHAQSAEALERALKCKM